MAVKKGSLYIGLLWLISLLRMMPMAECKHLAQKNQLEKVPVNRTFLIDYKTVYIPLGSSPITDYNVPDIKPKNWLAGCCYILQGRMRAYLPRIIRMGRTTSPPIADQFFQVVNTYSETFVVTRANQQAQVEVFWVSKLGKLMKVIAPPGFTKDIPNSELVFKTDFGLSDRRKHNDYVYCLRKGVQLDRFSLENDDSHAPDTFDISAYSLMVDWFISNQELFILNPDKVTKFAITESKPPTLKVLQATPILKSKYKQFCKCLGWFVFLGQDSQLIISPDFNPESPQARKITLNFDEPRLEPAGFDHFVLTGKPKPEAPKPGERPVSPFKRVIFYFDEVSDKGSSKLVLKQAQISTAKHLLVIWRHYKGVIRTAEGLFTIFKDAVALEYLGSKAPIVMLDRDADNIIGIQTKNASTVENIKLLLSGKSNLSSYSLNIINSKIVCTNPFFRQKAKRPSDTTPKEAEIDVTTRKLLHNIKIKFIPGLSPDSEAAKHVTISPAGGPTNLPVVQHLAAVNLDHDDVPAHNPSPIEMSAFSMQALVLNWKQVTDPSRQQIAQGAKATDSEMKYIVISAVLIVIMATLIACLPLVAKFAELRSIQREGQVNPDYQTELPLLQR